MVKLKTIQKRENLNYINLISSHEYNIVKYDNDELLVNICFQKGPRKEENSIHGIIDSDLLEIVRDRLKSFQETEFSTIENDKAITHIEEALLWMNKRVEDRLERNVLGTYNK